MSNINVMRKNLGPVTAYKYAVQQGYTGTEQEFAALMASYATVAEEAEAAKDDAVDAKTAAEAAQAAAEAAAEQAEGAIDVDDTLSVKGRAADAKVVGDKIEGVKSELSNSFVKSANLFDKNSVVTGKTLDVGTGKTIESMIDSQILNVSPIIPIEAGTYVCNSLFVNSANRLNVYDANGEYLGGFYGALQEDGSYKFSVTGAIVKQGRFTYSPTTLNVDTFMLVNGDTLPAEYESYGTKLNPAYVESQIQTAVESYEIPDGSIAPTKMSFAVHDPDTNLIDISKCELGYINGNTDGSVHSSTTFYVTPFVPLEAGKQYYFNLNYVFRGYYAFYDANKTYISGGGNAQAELINPPFSPPNNAAFGRFTILNQNALANAWICATNQMSTKPSPYADEVKTRFVEERPTDYKGNEITLFTKILCIGDSLTDGAFNESGGSRLIIRNRAFPAKLQALTGIECTNMGYAGYTSVQWYNAYQSEDLSGYDACIIQLGVNDALQGTPTADTTTAFNNIINKVKAENNGIKIFVATIIPANGYMTATMRTISETIRQIVSGLADANVYLVDLWAYGHTDDYLAYDAGHLSALGYLRLAEDYKAYIGYIIKNNINEFRYAQFIGTNYTYNGDSTTRQILY